MSKDKKDKKEAEKEAGEGEEGEGAAPAQKGGKKKLIILIAALVLMLGGGGAGMYFSGVLDGLLGKEEKEDTEEKEEHGKEEKGKDKKESKSSKKDKKGEGEEKEGEKKEGKEGKESKEGGKEGASGPDGVIYMEMPSFLVNLNSADSKKTSFLKMTVTLEVASAEDQAQIEPFKPRLVDTFNTYLRELRPSDLNGSAGLQRLREELMIRVNETVHPAKVNDILFKEVIVQ